MKKIGITGGSGLLGKLLTKEFKRNKISYSLFRGDIINKKHIKVWLLNNKNIEYIFHFAAFTSAEKSKKNQKKAFITNVTGTKNLLSAINSMKKKMSFFFQVHHMFTTIQKNLLKRALVLDQQVIMEKQNYWLRKKSGKIKIVNLNIV